ncbi:hypothetical protein AOQ73_09025 [Bradyrhizobium pachyrhizi]|uniref:hypothetical protein n=1 Tax=Bradyrhizobium pachyrhizi TaxID=280333 RepID=UPI0007054DA2|nr:hypothetical protein [Bradyrhizobium pachyrhizi]KRQ10021.1 hypothetical protein AOQ73_09025 [Bradyrhizobium pachyrhizi]
MNSTKSVIGRGLLVAGLLVSVGSARAAGSDDGFAAFWTQFKAAVSKSDQKAVSDMIKYPVLYQDVRKVSEFPVIWRGAFKPAHRACLAKQKPIKDTSPKGEFSYSAFCDSIIYSFAKDESGWKLTDFGVND